ncbi:hypothetical protein M8542_36655 [Amycolatopsis sp. OK19-0408]|uniref:Uncharacterized protein n=1 Tax=Amycolatopsis iheyensis TaxID=2945988 RepID=A0A9X2NJ20_9PSEU|nr:hypothetical protein [Amycolatopsis iheyensis]MCR6488376.1 hypothetical protein [Amycolatopsis iheyensis]
MTFSDHLVSTGPGLDAGQLRPRKLYRIWHDGFVALADEGSLRSLRRELVSGQAVADARGPYTVLADRLDERGAQHELDVEVTWTEPGLRVEVAAILSLRHTPGDPRAAWLLAAAASRPWRPEFEPPAERLGFAARADACDSGGLAVDARRLNIINEDTQRDEVAALLSQSITSPVRATALLVINRAAVVADVRGWSGMVQVVVIDEGLRQAINARVPLAQQLPSGYRLYAAPCDQQPDTIVAASMTETQLMDLPREELLQPLLHWRRRAKIPVPWQQDAALTGWLDRDDPFHPAPPETPAAESEARQLRRELEQTRRSLDISQRAHAELQRRHATDAAELDRLRARTVDLAHAATLAEENAQLHETVARYATALEDTEDDLAQALRRITHLLTTAGQPISADVPAAPPREYASFPALLAAARATFGNLTITAAEESARALDEDGKAAVWRARAWAALSTLDSYAAARTSGSAAGGGVVTLREFIRTGQPGALISMQALKLSESDTVTSNDRLRAARVFPVPVEVDSSGYGFFGAHIALEKFKPPAPRLHFLDDTGRSGLLCVGYLGSHLPNTRTN